MIICDCKHGINIHSRDGCQHVIRHDEDCVCPCFKTPEEIASALQARIETLEGAANKAVGHLSNNTTQEQMQVNSLRARITLEKALKGNQ